MSLPTITTPERIFPVLKLWEQKLNSGLVQPLPPRPPMNHRAAGGAVGSTGTTLTWEPVSGADGYQIQASSNGDFSAAPIIATISALSGTSWVDHTQVTGVKRWYRIRATSGTIAQPQSVPSVWSAPIVQTSGSAMTVYDQQTYLWVHPRKV